MTTFDHSTPVHIDMLEINFLNQSSIPDADLTIILWNSLCDYLVAEIFFGLSVASSTASLEL